MSFPMSSRFSEYYSECSPSPTKYNIPSTFEDHAPTNGNKAPPLVGHKCDASCLSGTCKHHNVKKQLNGNKRLSLDPNVLKFMGNSSSSSIKSTRWSVGVGNNKENASSSSNIPRFRKNAATEGHAPRFMTRHDSVHNCLTNNDQDVEVSSPTTLFNRNSVKRKSVKPIKKEKRASLEIAPPPKQDTSSNNLTNHRRPFNVSYTVLPKIEETTSDFNSGNNDDVRRHPLKRYQSTKCLLTEANNEENVIMTSLSASKLLKKDSELVKELSRNCGRSKKYYEIAFKQEDVAPKPKHRDIFALNDCNVIFLVSEEFIDDDFDAYMTGLTETKAHWQVLHNKELYDMTKYLVRVYLEKQQVVKKPVIRRKNFGKSKKALKKDIWDEVEGIIRAAILQLKGEFQREIMDKTNDKLDKLVSELKSVVLGAHEDIGSVCERTTTDLLARLQNVAHKL